MAKCKTKDCVKEAAPGSKYCPACQDIRDKNHKTIAKYVLSVCACIGVAVTALFRRGDKS